MAKKRSNVATALMIIAAGVVVGGAVTYLITGRDPVEEQIDKLIATLNEKLGKSWGRFATVAIKAALGKTIGAELIAIVDVVHHAEEFGTKHGWSGLQKRGHAVAKAKAQATARA
jgi:hypothetical protein